MDDFQFTSAARIVEAMGFPRNVMKTDHELEELGRIHEKILTDTSLIATKEIEAYLTINSCRTYDQYADYLVRERKINSKTTDREKLIGRLRTRAHRGRKRIIEEIERIYETKGPPKEFEVTQLSEETQVFVKKDTGNSFVVTDRTQKKR